MLCPFQHVIPELRGQETRRQNRYSDTKQLLRDILQSCEWTALLFPSRPQANRGRSRRCRCRSKPIRRRADAKTVAADKLLEFVAVARECFGRLHEKAL